ncbi:aspartyl protease AED3-like [Amaranthus tricolor]|uniref:aspartyl protease AED3-like n=1 Tax=Amaranthus tricolor TaxID=29722 RepID=UPI0025879155|nr:aspartyl protease AED3-like [Amaranthus tricolor]
MKSLHIPLFFFFLLLPLHTLSKQQGQTQPTHYCNLPTDKGSTLKVFHVSSPCSPFKPKKMSWEESVIQMLIEDQARSQYLTSLVARKSVAPVAWARQLIQSPTYIVRVKVGTPAQTFLMALDTSNDAAWLPCNGCQGCGSSHFNSDKSTSFKSVACGAPQCQQVINSACVQNLCSFNQTYGGSTLAAGLSQDTIALAQDPIPGYVFGCIQKTTGASVPPQGLLGLGRGPLSLLAQTQSLYKSTFSYCLPSFRSSNFSGSLRLGPVAQPKRIHYTPLLKNPKRPSLYYVNLIGIKVGRKTVDIPPQALAFNPNTGAGTVIDSGTVYTRLVVPAYTAVRDEFRRRMGKANVTSLGGFDTCYNVPITIPSITFMFQGMNLSLAQDNFMLRSTSTSIACLAMAASPENVNAGLNIIANMQQQNHRVVFDVPNNRIGISRENCT